MTELHIRPDWDAIGESLRHTWAGMVNIDQFRWLVRKDCLQHLAMAHAEIGARQVRAVGMLCDELRVIGDDPAAFFAPKPRPKHVNWQVVDYVLDELLELGIKPLFTTSFMPTELASGAQTCFATRSNVTLPKDWTAWTRLIEDAVRHQIQRYGREEVRSWQFEVWNEPNLSGFFAGDRDAWHRLWRETWTAIKRVDPELRIGGPSTARGEWLEEFLVFARSHHCVPDYLITHVYNNDGAMAPLSPFDGPQEDKSNNSPHFASGVIRGARTCADQLGFRGEIHWNEWGSTWHPFAPLRESAQEAAWICKTMAEVSQCADRFAYWCMSDIYDQVGYGAETLHGNYGMLSLQGLRKPAWFAHQLLERLGDRRLPLSGEGLDAHRNALAANGSNGKQVLIYASSPIPAIDAPAGEQRCRVRLPGKPQRPPRLWRIAAGENDIVATWRSLGAPAYLTRADRAYLHDHNHLNAAPAPLIAERDGIWEAIFPVRFPGVALLELPE